MIVIATDIIPITPSDANPIREIDPSIEGGATYRTILVSGIRATGAGNVSYKALNGETRTIAFLAGETRYFITNKVFAASTTATGLEGIVI